MIRLFLVFHLTIKKKNPGLKTAGGLLPISQTCSAYATKSVENIKLGSFRIQSKPGIENQVRWHSLVPLAHLLFFCFHFIVLESSFEQENIR
jgi:hypothetical protein